MGMTYTAYTQDTTGGLHVSVHSDVTHDHGPAFKEIQSRLDNGEQLLFLSRGDQAATALSRDEL